jgi:hypothetical protein
MNLRRTIIGAAIGAASGVVLDLTLEILGHIEAPWFAIIIGLLVGICVRKFDLSCAGHVSYVRGAIAGSIALCAIVGSTYVVGVVMTRQAALANEKARIVEARPATEDVASDEGQNQLNELELATRAAASRPATGFVTERTGRAGDFGALQFTFIAVGTFIAYELGRGTGRGRARQKHSIENSTPTEPAVETNDNQPDTS